MSFARQNQISGPVPVLSPTVGLVAGTHVMTMDGDLPVEYLTPGDRVLTRNGARVLAAISVRVEEDSAMVRINTGTLGHGRPCADMLVSLHQMILIRDWRANVLYGAPQALVAAGRLADGMVNKIENLSKARIFTLEFAEDVVIYADGLEMAFLAAKVGA